MIRPRDTRRLAPPGSAVAAARRELLAQLHRSGPLYPAELGGRWPRTRHHVRLVLSDLAGEGLVVSDGGGGRPARIRLTAAGRDALDTA